ncbi:MAG: ribonuclease P protein component [Bacteroidetes bacterium]|nr:ribonuclease P protein component [Bacteroidota bacterium]
MHPTFSKNERLHEFRLIRTLFAEGRVFSIPPLRVTWMRFKEQSGPLFQIMISVPKAIHRKSTDRNIIKRRIREAYRLNKSILPNEGSTTVSQISFCITYTSKDILTYRAIQDKIILLLRRLKEECEKDF